MDEERLQREEETLALINRVSRELSATLDVGAVAERLLREVTTVIGAEGASVWLWEGEREGYLACEAIYHVGEDISADDLCVPPDEGIASWVAKEGESVIAHAAAEDERFCPAIDEETGLCTESVIAAPLQARGRTLGVLEVVNKVEGQFDGGDRFLIETLAASAAVAIDNADLVHRLEMRNRDLQAFAYTVAHDIKNSLGLVVGYADTLRRSIADLSSEELKRYLGIIRKHGRKAGEIVDELLLLAELGETEMERELLDMGSILEDVQDRLEAEIDERDALIGVPEAWPKALGHGPWVEEVWCNYIANALKYGGDRPRIQVGGEPEGRMVRFWVRDEGPGLTAEQQEGLFAPFARRSTRCKGYGLGLSIVRRIVEKLGGEVGADCAPGQGCGFWFTLPAAEAHGGS